MFTPGLHACAYKTASGLRKWESSDPAGELAAKNLYALLANASISKVDVLGLLDFAFKQIRGTPHWIGNMGEWTQPSGKGSGVFAQQGWQATSGISVTFDKPGHVCCNSVSTDIPSPWESNNHKDSAALIVFLIDAAPGTYQVEIKASASATARSGASDGDPGANVTVNQVNAPPGKRQVIAGTATPKHPFSDIKIFTVTVTVSSKKDSTYLADFIPVIGIRYCGSAAAMGTLEVLSYTDPSGIRHVAPSVPNPYE